MQIQYAIFTKQIASLQCKDSIISLQCHCLLLVSPSITPSYPTQVKNVQLDMCGFGNKWFLVILEMESKSIYPLILYVNKVYIIPY